MFKRMKSKKGFTLAELLIVVAIIAVLTAIAVPLFVGALNNAEDNVKEANMRAVRAEAVSKVLLAEKPTEGTTDSKGIFTYDNATTSFKYPDTLKVKAFVSNSGAILQLEFTGSHTADVCRKPEDGDFGTGEGLTAGKYDQAKKNDVKYVVEIVLTLDDLSK